MTLPDLDAATADRHPSTRHVARYFAYSHLPEGPLRDASQWCASLALNRIEATKDGDELTAGLRKLLEAKDCFVRAQLEAPDAG